MQEQANHLISMVDDDQSIREATARLLRSSGFQIETFSSAEAFLDSPHLRETRCLILDIRMPGMSGLELQRRLAAKGLHIPIVFVSAHGSEALRKETMQAGAIDLLSKPCSGEALLQAIRSALESATRARPVGCS